MFYLYQSNRLEYLFTELCTLFDQSPGDPLVPEKIVVQNPGMGSWLSRQTALRTGVAANMEFPLPARFIWQIFESQLILPDDVQDFNRQVLLWRIYRLLDGSASEPEFTEIREYLHNDADGRKAFQFAGRIADLFDQYLVYRPDMLAEWEKGKSREWQALLWQRLTESGPYHRAKLLQLFRKKYRTGSLVPEYLPKRITIFGISSLAPVYLEIIDAVASVVDVHLFHLSPCRSYWSDLVSQKAMAKKRALWRSKKLPDVSEYYESGYALLASLGTVGQEFSQLLNSLNIKEKELYAVPAGTHLLAALQKDILDLEDDLHGETVPTEKMEDDRSIQFHICHSRLREVQVLHDRLLEMFERDPELKPGDIMVMAPDIESYGSSVRAVFDCAEDERFIPWSLADRSVRGEQPLAGAFMALFDIAVGRFEAPGVISFLEYETVQRRFGIDEEGLARIRKWVRESGVRWGLDAHHRQEFAHEMADAHSWAFGLNRMLLGYIAGQDSEIFHGVSPYASFSSGDSVLLGRLSAFQDRLRNLAKRIKHPKTADEWARLLLVILDDFFDPGTSEKDFHALLELQEAIREFQDNCDSAGFTAAISLQIVKSHFIEVLSRTTEGQKFFSGRVTFCNMVPMRSVPFNVICLLGMNDTDYPRSQRVAAFDQMARNHMTGDRNRRNDDCYLFLEALISSRKVFSVSWIGRDQQDNSIRNPSVVVSSLLDHVKKFGQEVWGESYKLPVTEHPLQPFSQLCFDTTLPTGSYAAEWLPGGRNFSASYFLTDPLPEPDDEWLTLDTRQLTRFWSHPVRYFLQERLGLRFWEEDQLIPNTEPFQADGLDRYLLVNELADDILAGHDGEKYYPVLHGSGRLPHGSIGKNVFSEMNAAAAGLVKTVDFFIGKPLTDLEVDLNIDSFSMNGWLDSLYDTGLVRFRGASLKSKDLVKLWVEHLVLNAVAPESIILKSYHVATDKTACLQPVTDPRGELQQLLALYWQGIREPLRFYPRTSEACYLANAKGKSFEPYKTWNSAFRYIGEGEEHAYKIALNGRDPFDQAFMEHALTVFTPLYRHLEIVDEKF